MLGIELVALGMLCTHCISELPSPRVISSVLEPCPHRVSQAASTVASPLSRALPTVFYTVRIFSCFE